MRLAPRITWAPGIESIICCVPGTEDWAAGIQEELLCTWHPVHYLLQDLLCAWHQLPCAWHLE